MCTTTPNRPDSSVKLIHIKNKVILLKARTGPAVNMKFIATPVTVS